MAQQVDVYVQSCIECGHQQHLDNPGEHKFEYIKSDEELLQEGLTCPLTLEPLFDAVDLPCGHTFSKYAITAHFQIKKKGCPVCKSLCNKLTSVSIIIRNILDKLQIRCPKQCGSIIERSTIKDHLKICPSTLVFCSNKLKGEQCMHTAIRKNMNIHEMTECNFRIMPCPGNCGIIARDFGTHNCVIHLKNELDIVKKDLDEFKKNQEKMLKENNAMHVMSERQMYLQMQLNVKKVFENLGNVIKNHADDIKNIKNRLPPLETLNLPELVMAPAQPAMAPAQPAMAPARIIIAPTKFETLIHKPSNFEIILKNAEGGNSYCQYNLGHRYEFGHEVIKSKDDAIKWYTKAANAGVLLAKDALSRLLFEDDVIEISKPDENSRKRKAETNIDN